MTPEQYLISAIKHKCHCKKAWIVSAFTVSMESETLGKTIYPFKLLREPFGFFYYDENLEKKQLEVKPQEGKPLFHKYDKITIKKADIPFIQEETIETTVGRLLLNLVIIGEPFYGRMPYINKKFKPDHVEALIAPVLMDSLPEGKQKEPGKYYVDELIRFTQAVDFICGLASVFSESITRAGMLPPPGRKEYKKKLLEKYEGKLRDPIENAHFVKELKMFDEAYLKQHDSSFGKFNQGKVGDARVKTFLTQGGESNEFIGQLDTTPIVKSLDEGMDLDPESFTAAANTIRYGSFSRGAETVNGGVVSKALQQSLDTWKITDGDCGATLGVTRTYDASGIKKLVNRYIIQAGKPVLIETIEQAREYTDKPITIRSPQYCRKEGLQTCEVCAGKALSKYRQGQIIPNMEVSAGIMNDSLKKMHNTSIKSNTFELSAVI